jgi:hypothetical protein
MIYDNFCKNKNCDHYIEWEFFDMEEQPYICYSCDLVGMSYNVLEIPIDCKYKEEISSYKGED